MPKFIRRKQRADEAEARATLDVMLEYWEGRRQGRAMPARADIDPVEIAEILPFLFLVDVIGDAEDFRYRLVGTDIVANTSDDYTGRRSSELRDVGTQDALMALYREVTQRRAPVTRTIPYVTRAGATRHYVVAVAPLSNDGESVDILLGCAVHL